MGAERIIIIGAGAAGLACARAYREHHGRRQRDADYERGRKLIAAGAGAA